MDIKDNITEAIGNTPIVRVDQEETTGNLAVKLEYMNPGGSMKDRIGIGMLEKAEEAGELEDIHTIVEPTSGNTGIAIALAALTKGYEAVLTVSESKSDVKKNMMKAFGAEVIECPSVPHDHPESYHSKAEELAQKEGYYRFNQYESKRNPEVHYETTGKEIIEQTNGEITHFVMAMGTGGTISGVSKRLKEHDPSIKVYGVDAVSSNITDLFYEKEDWEPEKNTEIEGIGRTYKPGATSFENIDEVIEIEDEEAFESARKLASQNGVFAGISAGAVHSAMRKLDAEIEDEDALIVGIMCDSGNRYMEDLYS